VQVIQRAFIGTMGFQKADMEHPRLGAVAVD